MKAANGPTTMRRKALQAAVSESHKLTAALSRMPLASHITILGDTTKPQEVFTQSGICALKLGWSLKTLQQGKFPEFWCLSETLGDTMARVDIVPEWAPSVYGTAVHVDFAARVKLQGLRGVEVEQSFFDEAPRGYGYPGSIRTDVLLRNDSGDIVAIYDVKTGGALS